jgi:hypothetical protein
MPDDMLRDAIETSRRVIGSVDDFDTHGKNIKNYLFISIFFCLFVSCD